MINQVVNTKKLVNELLNYNISPYELVEFVKNGNKNLISSIRRLIVENSSPYVRLCAAWCVGELGDKNSISLLTKAYKEEKEDNVRANIAWALFMIDFTHIDLTLFQAFLRDDYFLIPLVALKRIASLPNLQGKIDFYEIYSKTTSTLLKLELLRNILCFSFSKNINVILKQELYESEDILIKMELINAIGLTNQLDSVNLLMQYYSERTSEILENELLAFQYVSATLSLVQSKPYAILQEIYLRHENRLIRWKIVESLASAGGPKCLQVLKTIYSLEDEEDLKKQIQKYIDIIPITVK